MLWNTSYLFMTVAFKQNKDTSLLKLDDAFPETIITVPITRANLARFTSDKVSKHDVCPQGRCDGVDSGI